jgi:hypothetical protein
MFVYENKFNFRLFSYAKFIQFYFVWKKNHILIIYFESFRLNKFKKTIILAMNLSSTKIKFSASYLSTSEGRTLFHGTFDSIKIPTCPNLNPIGIKNISKNALFQALSNIKQIDNRISSTIYNFYIHFRILFKMHVNCNLRINFRFYGIF